MPKPDCSPLAKLIAQLAMNIATRPEIKTLDHVTAELKRHIPEIDRKAIVDAINEAHSAGPRNVTDLQKKLADLKLEAKNDTGLRATVAEYQKALAEGRQPETKAKAVPPPPEAIAKLRDERDALKEQLGRNDPKDREKVRARIAELERHIKSSTQPPKAERPDAPADLQALRDKRDGLMQQIRQAAPERREEVKASLREQIADLNKHLAAGTVPAKQAAKAVPADVAKLRVERNELKAIVAKADPATREKLRARIKELRGHIQAGTNPSAPAPRGAPPADVAALRSERDKLRSQLAKDSPEARAKIQARIDELEGHLKAGTLPAPKAPTGTDVPDRVAALRTKRQSLMDALRKSDPALRQRFEAQIAEMTARLDSGDIPAKESTAPGLMSPELERLAYQRDRLRKRINDKINALRPQGFWGRVSEPINLARAIQTMHPFTAVLKQAGFTTYAHPVVAAKSLIPTIRAMASDMRARQINDAILSRENAPMYARSGLYLAPMDGTLHASEETFLGRWAGKIPGFSGSKRAYITFLNQTRADLYDHFAATLARNGEPTLTEAKDIANFINKGTGRGGLGKAESAAVPLGQAFFSPRYAASRFQLLAGQPFYSGEGSARTKVLIAKEYARALSGIATVYALGAAAGGKEEWDPRSSNFGKIKFGNVYLDPLFGLSQATVFLTRMATGEKKTATGRVVPIRDSYHPLDAFRADPIGKVPPRGDRASAVVGNFLRSKLAPAAGAAVDIASGQNMMGEPRTPATAAREMLTPINFGDIYKEMRSNGIDSKSVALGILNLFGMGMQTHENEPPSNP